MTSPVRWAAAPAPAITLPKKALLAGVAVSFDGLPSVVVFCVAAVQVAAAAARTLRVVKKVTFILSKLSCRRLRDEHVFVAER